MLIVLDSFKYLKCHRNPYTRNLVPGIRTFTFPPSSLDSYELDFSLLMVGIAWTRGLFQYSDIEELWNGTEVYLAKNADVDKQPVFVACKINGDLLATEAMREKALNPKLQELCHRVGLLHRNTLYSFRRTAITEVRRTIGTESAKEIAGHKQSGQAIYNYDDQALADMDIPATRLKGTGMDREEIREFFNQATTALYRAEDDPNQMGLTARLDQETKLRMKNDSDYIAIEKT